MPYYPVSEAEGFQTLGSSGINLPVTYGPLFFSMGFSWMSVKVPLARRYPGLNGLYQALWHYLCSMLQLLSHLRQRRPMVDESNGE
jgi:hypothetical protein